MSSFDMIILLQQMGILSRTKYCDSNLDLESIAIESDCTDCPEYAVCHDGVAWCKGDRILIRGQCLYDQREIEHLHAQMETYSLSLPSSVRAERECSSYWLYTLFGE